MLEKEDKSNLGMESAKSNYAAEINVTPMVDIMLVMLIIFMIVTPMIDSGVSILLPKSKNPEEDHNINKESAIVVAIPENGVYYLGKDEISHAQLTEKIRSLLEDRKPMDRVVYIKGGQQVNYGSIVETIAAAREAGVDRIGLVSEKLKTEIKQQ
jgi:biopolymer transport protein ExbD/biopolymer transport protein TolR